MVLVSMGDECGVSRYITTCLRTSPDYRGKGVGEALMSHGMLAVTQAQNGVLVGLVNESKFNQKLIDQGDTKIIYEWVS